MIKPEPNMLKILPIIPSSTSQKFYPLFLFYSHIIIPILFFCIINVSDTYWHLEKQELNYVLVFCRYIVQILVTQVKWSIKVIVAFLKLTHLPCHCLPLILISDRYQLLFHNTFECPIILNYASECPTIPRIMPAKSVTYNYAGTLGSGLIMMNEDTGNQYKHAYDESKASIYYI